jgi:hypothetical protein
MQKEKINPISLLWVTDSEFCKRIDTIRKEYGLDPKKLPNLIEFEIIRNFKWKLNQRNLFFNRCLWIVYEYGLWGWEKELEYFIGTGSVPKIETITPPQIIETKGGLNITFSIVKPISITHLHEWANRHWLKGSRIWKSVKKYFYSPDFAPEKSLRNFNFIKRLIELREQEGKKFEEIADILTREFKIDDPEAKVNANSVKKLYHDYKKYSQNLKKKLGIPELDEAS